MTEKMRYILDDDGYIESVSFDAHIICKEKECTIYSGNIPTGYKSLEDWATNSNIRAFFISNNNLTYDSERDTYLKTLWESELGLEDNRINVINGNSRIQSGLVTITPTKNNSATSLDVDFENEFATIPIISLTSDDEVDFLYYTNKTKAGFTINVNKKENTPINVDWMAIGKK